MSVPKKKKSHSRTRFTRNHHALSPISLATCTRCGAARKSHTICGTCGTYRDRTVIDVEAETE